MSAEVAVYLDSSALLKLIVSEPESSALRRFLKGKEPFVSSALARVEVARTARAYGIEALARSRAVLEEIALLELDDIALDAAANLEAPLRTLDAIHVAAASSIGSDLTSLVTYDRRMADAATSLGLPVAAPH